MFFNGIIPKSAGVINRFPDEDTFEKITSGGKHFWGMDVSRALDLSSLYFPRFFFGWNRDGDMIEGYATFESDSDQANDDAFLQMYFNLQNTYNSMCFPKGYYMSVALDKPDCMYDERIIVCLRVPKDDRSLYEITREIYNALALMLFLQVRAVKLQSALEDDPVEDSEFEFYSPMFDSWGHMIIDLRK